jgi:hypothetical protein
MSNIIVIRLVNGEEVIAKINSQTEDVLVLKSPRILHITNMGNGQAGASFMPMLLLAGSQDIVNVPRTSLAAWTDNVNPEYEKRYLESVSGIQLATSLNG